jgi:hypothetical protein
VTAPWIGVDPGATGTGVVARAGPDLLWWRVVERGADEDPIPGRGVGVGSRYVHAVIAAVREAFEAVPSARIAVEGVVAPGGWRRGRKDPIQPGTIVALGIVLGGVLAVWPDALVVPPNHHGEALLVAYPPELVSPSERRLGLHRPARHSSALNHARSAFDVAGAAPGFARTVAAIRRGVSR